MTCWWWPNIECWLGSFVTSIAKKPHFFYFPGGWGLYPPPPPPSLWIHPCDAIFPPIKMLIVNCRLIYQFKPNGISNSHQLDQFIYILKVAGCYFLYILEKSPRKRGNISWLSIYLYFAFKKAETCIPLSCVLIFHSFMKSETCIGDSSRRNDHGPK